MPFTPLEPNCSTRCLLGQFNVCDLPKRYMTWIGVQAATTPGFDALTNEGILALFDKLIDEDRKDGKEPPLLNEVYNRFHEMYEKEFNPAEIAKG